MLCSIRRIIYYDEIYSDIVAYNCRDIDKRLSHLSCARCLKVPPKRAFQQSRRVLFRARAAIVLLLTALTRYQRERGEGGGRGVFAGREESAAVNSVNHPDAFSDSPFIYIYKQIEIK